MSYTIIVSTSSSNLRCTLRSLPLIFHIAILEAYGHSCSHVSQTACESAQHLFVKRFLSRQEQLVPEQSLKRVERQSVVCQKAHVLVRSLDVFFMKTVYKQHIVGCEVDAGYLSTYNGQQQLQSYHLVATHAYLAVAAQVLAACYQTEVGACHHVACLHLIVQHTLQERLLFRLLCLRQPSCVTSVACHLLAGT